MFVLKSLGILTCLSSVCNAACEADGNLCADERCDVSANWPELLVVYSKDLPVSALMEQAGDALSVLRGRDRLSKLYPKQRAHKTRKNHAAILPLATDNSSNSVYSTSNE